MRVVRALRVCGTRRPLLLGTCPCALVVAGAVPLWRASSPRVVRRASSGLVALGAPVGFPAAVVPFPIPGACAPGFTGWLRGARGGRPRTGLIVLPPAPAEAGTLSSLRVVPVRGPALGLSLAGPSGVGLGLRALRWLACVDPVTDVSGFPYPLSFDGELGWCTGAVSCGCRQSPCGSEDATPGSRACVPVLVRPGRGGRAGLPGAFWCASPFPLAALSFCFAWPPPGWVCPSPGPLFSRSLLFCFVCFFRFSVFFSLRPLFLLLFLGSGPGCPGPWRFVLFVLLAWRFLALRALSLSLCCLAVSRSLVVPPPPPLSLAVVAVPCCLALVFFSLVCAALFLAFRVFRPRVPRALALVCVCCARLSVLCVVFFSAPQFFLRSRLFCVPWLAAGCCPPPLLCLAVFRCFRSVPSFFFLSSCAPPLSPAFPGFRPRLPWALALCFVCLSMPPAARLSVRAPLVCVSRLTVGCSLVVASPPPLPFCVSPFSSLLLGALVFFSSVRPRCLRLSLVSGPGCPGPRRCALFALLAFRFSALRALSPLSCFLPRRWLLPGGCCPPPPPLCVSRFSSLPLGAVCRLLCSAVCPWVRCCAAMLRVVPPSALLSCVVLFCCACLVPLLVAPCPLALPVALGTCALRRCVLRCSPVLCSLCCVCFVVAWWCVLLFAALLCAVCVPGRCAVRSLSSLLCAVLCFAVLVHLRCAVRVVRAVAGAWCCGALLCVVLCPLVCWGAVLGLEARGCLLVACFGVGVPV